MFRYALRACALLAALAVSVDAAEQPAAQSGSIPPKAEMAAAAESLVTEISDWLASNFDLPRIEERPAIAFVSRAELENLRMQGGTGHGDNVGAGVDASVVVAVYHLSKRTIFLSDRWTGKTPADQSVLVHEMVHHLQNLADMKFECPTAREKLAYKAQNRWLGRFGTDLETEFEIDAFTVLVASACM